MSDEIYWRKLEVIIGSPSANLRLAIATGEHPVLLRTSQTISCVVLDEENNGELCINEDFARSRQSRLSINSRELTRITN